MSLLMSGTVMRSNVTLYLGPLMYVSDGSVAKGFGILSLNDWLDANAAGLPGVDVDLLKAKLHRDA